MVDIDGVASMIARDQLPPVSAEDLKAGWIAFQPLRESRCGGSTDEIPPAVFLRCVVLADLDDRGVPLTDLVFESVADRPFSKSYTIENLLNEISL